MGCIHSKNASKQKVMSSEANVQDEARSYRSKVGAMRIILKNVHSRRAFIKYLEAHKKAEFVKCFQELEDVHLIKDDRQLRLELKKVISNYRSVSEVAEMNKLEPDAIEYALWDCFGPLRHTDVDSVTIVQANKYTHIAQDSLLSQVCTLFEMFLESKEYEDCKSFTVENQKLYKNSGSDQNVKNGPRAHIVQARESSVSHAFEESNFHKVGM